MVGLVGLLFLIGGIGALMQAKPSFVVVVGTAGGQTNAYSSPDAGVVKKITEAVTGAAVARGQ